ncbi:hypothetical protein D3C81_1986060 [compost metagenome]
MQQGPGSLLQIHPAAADQTTALTPNSLHDRHDFIRILQILRQLLYSKTLLEP